MSGGMDRDPADRSCPTVAVRLQFMPEGSALYGYNESTGRYDRVRVDCDGRVVWAPEFDAFVKAANELASLLESPVATSNALVARKLGDYRDAPRPRSPPPSDGKTMRNMLDPEEASHAAAVALARRALVDVEGRLVLSPEVEELIAAGEGLARIARGWSATEFSRKEAVARFEKATFVLRSRRPPR